MKSKPGFWRWRNIIRLTLGVPLLVFCVWGAWAVHWAYTAKPVYSVAYDAKLQALSTSLQAEYPLEGNGWDELKEIIQLSRDIWWSYVGTFLEPNTPHQSLPKPKDWPERWWPPEAQEILTDGIPDSAMTHARAILKRQAQAGVFDRLAALNHRYFLRPKPDGLLLNSQNSELGNYRRLARLSTARQRLAHMEGDSNVLADAFRDTLMVARAAGRQCLLLDRLTAIGIQNLAFEELRLELIERPMPEPVLLRLLDTVERVDDEPGLMFTFEGERLAWLEIIQLTHTDDGQGDGRVIVVLSGAVKDTWADPRGSTSPIFNVFGLFLPKRSETTRVLHQFFDLVSTCALAAPTSKTQSISQVEAWVKTLPNDQTFPRIFLDSTLRAIHSHHVDILERGATRLMLAIEIHRARTGSSPAALADLVPGILPALPVDPWNPDGFVYRPDASKPWGYMLYSKGADGVDDRAPYDEDTNMNALKPEGAGTDFHFVYPRYRVGN
ncbi:MAG: hypothetical protein IPM33_11650 [Phycisphaerales bacterium]|nr:hypothetical protein [Phycisphaerales bacterium]